MLTPQTTSITLRPDRRLALKAESLRTGRSMNQLVVERLNPWLDRLLRKKGPRFSHPQPPADGEDIDE